MTNFFNLRDIAEVLDLAGEHLGRFTQGFDTADLKDAKSVLEEPSSRRA